MYTTARYILGWSEEEFWNAAPRKYFSVLYKVGEIKKVLSEGAGSTEPLVGKAALSALSQIAGKVR